MRGSFLYLVPEKIHPEMLICKPHFTYQKKRSYKNSQMKQLKVLFHINEVERWDTALGNITNLLKDVGEDAVQAVALANGPSVNAFIDDEKLKKIKELIDKGVKFQTCRNSLKKMCSSGVCLTEDSLPSFIGVVPAGITEIIKMQGDGYAYVKP